MKSLAYECRTLLAVTPNRTKGGSHGGPLRVREHGALRLRAAGLHRVRGVMLPGLLLSARIDSLLRRLRRETAGAALGSHLRAVVAKAVTMDSKGKAFRQLLR